MGPLINESVLSNLVVAAVFVTLAYASVLDVRFRDIPEITWVPATALAIAVNLLLGNYDVVHLFFALLPAGVVFLMAFLGLMGGADALALLMIGLAHPRFMAVPISLLTLIYSLIPPIAIMIYYFLINMISYRGILSSIKCVKGGKSKFLLPLLGRPMSIRSYLNARFTYPLTIPLKRGEYVCRTYFGDDDEEAKIKDEMIKLLRSGDLSEDDVIIVTPALPHILFILLGYVAAIMTPQTLIVRIFISMLAH